MKRTYWEKIAPNYHQEIFDVKANDKKLLIANAIEQFANKDGIVVDAGCAIGKWLPLLSPLFKKVIATDISSKNLKLAKKEHLSLTNVQYERINWSDKKIKLPTADLVVCINAILTPSAKERKAFIQNIYQTLNAKGKFVLSVPAMESWLLTSLVQQTYKIDEDLFPTEKNKKDGLKKWNNLLKGNVDIDHVPHKHFLKEELSLLLSMHGFSVKKIQKINYSWQTEFINPPKNLKNPYPWDWFVLAEKK